MEAEKTAAAERVAADQRAEEERRAAERLAEQQRLAEQERLAEESRAAAAAAVIAAAAAASQETVAGSQSIDSADSGPLAAEPDAGPDAGPDAKPLAAEPNADQSPDPVTAAAVEPPREELARPVAVSSLTRTKYVAPKYPRGAERRSVSGWVDVVFTVATDGTVTYVEVIGSQPGDTFVTSATKAVERWRFEPVVEDGVVVEKRAAVRMMFAIE